MGAWEPTPEFYLRLLAPMPGTPTCRGRIRSSWPIPLEQAPEALGEIAGLAAEWKWDGIRAQLIRRGGRTFLWSRGEELLTDRFPEVEEAGALLPEGTVLDGEILPWAGEAPLPFAQLQRRIGRKTLGKEDPRRGAGGPGRLRPAGIGAARICGRFRSASGAGAWRRCSIGRAVRRPSRALAGGRCSPAGRTRGAGAGSSRDEWAPRG